MAASTASRPLNGRINVHEPGDYPIILGDSLKNDSSTESQYISFRYNWEPRSGFLNHKGTLKRANGQPRLVYRDQDSESLMYDYDAATAKDESDSNDASTSRLALVFDPKRSAYVLEQISHAYDLNLASAHDQSKEQVRQHRRISASDSENEGNTVQAQRSTERNEDEADSSNPFDFRHFISEAKEMAEKAALPTGGRTPVPGSRTPLSGISSPSLPPGRFLSTSNTQFRPAPTSAPAPIPTSAPKKAPLSKPTSTANSKKQPATKRKPVVSKQTTSKPISNEVVTDSSDDDAHVTTSRSRPATSQPEERKSKRKDSSVSRGRSPAMQQDDGGLVIDFGSPPRETMPKRTIDLEAFRSQTHTPIMEFSSNKPASHSHKDRETDQSNDEMEEDDYSYRDDQDKNARDEDEDDDMDIDEDVEALALPSPHSKRMEEIENTEKALSPPTPLPPHLPDDGDDNDEDLLTLELLAALGEGGEDDDREGGVDDESEVSEEE